MRGHLNYISFLMYTQLLTINETVHISYRQQYTLLLKLTNI